MRIKRTMNWMTRSLQRRKLKTLRQGAFEGCHPSPGIGPKFFLPRMYSNLDCGSNVLRYTKWKVKDDEDVVMLFKEACESASLQVDLHIFKQLVVKYCNAVVCGKIPNLQTTVRTMNKASQKTLRNHLKGKRIEEK
eukprot:TRINITY_DN24987_c0_g2_i4.p1 TRINITY_DN24987_c0_g2~~TRINITY_DN24987_c0_g2_i4.p1  ORF type:complete len:136 (-),score=33.21 TRINITY_DN24987_c0_g2_i4:3-410(-)